MHFEMDGRRCCCELLNLALLHEDDRSNPNCGRLFNEEVKTIMECSNGQLRLCESCIAIDEYFEKVNRLLEMALLTGLDLFQVWIALASCGHNAGHSDISDEDSPWFNPEPLEKSSGLVDILRLIKKCQKSQEQEQLRKIELAVKLNDEPATIESSPSSESDAFQDYAVFDADGIDDRYRWLADQSAEWLSSKENLLMLLARIFWIPFPVYTSYQQFMLSMSDDDSGDDDDDADHNQTDRSSQLNTEDLRVHLNKDAKKHRYLARNLCFFIKIGGLNTLHQLLGRQSCRKILPVSIVHNISIMIMHIQRSIEIRQSISSEDIIKDLFPLRGFVIRYMCELSDSTLRNAINTRNIPEMVQTTFKDLKPDCEFSHLHIAVRCIMSMNSSLRSHGMAQILDNISTTENASKKDRASGLDMKLAEWLQKVNIIDAVFSPSACSDVIRQSQGLLVFMSERGALDDQYIDAIWTAFQRKGCGRVVMDILNSMQASLQIGAVKRLLQHLANFPPERHTEQTIILVASLTRIYWNSLMVRDDFHIGNTVETQSVSEVEDDDDEEDEDDDDDDDEDDEDDDEEEEDDPTNDGQNDKEDDENDHDFTLDGDSSPDSVHNRVVVKNLRSRQVFAGGTMSHNRRRSLAMCDHQEKLMNQTIRAHSNDNLDIDDIEMASPDRGGFCRRQLVRRSNYADVGEEEEEEDDNDDDSTSETNSSDDRTCQVGSDDELGDDNSVSGNESDKEEDDDSMSKATNSLGNSSRCQSPVLSVDSNAEHEEHSMNLQFLETSKAVKENTKATYKKQQRFAKDAEVEDGNRISTPSNEKLMCSPGGNDPVSKVMEWPASADLKSVISDIGSDSKLNCEDGLETVGSGQSQRSSYSPKDLKDFAEIGDWMTDSSSLDPMIKNSHTVSMDPINNAINKKSGLKRNGSQSLPSDLAGKLEWAKMQLPKKRQRLLLSEVDSGNAIEEQNEDSDSGDNIDGQEENMSNVDCDNPQSDGANIAETSPSSSHPSSSSSSSANNDENDGDSASATGDQNPETMQEDRQTDSVDPTASIIMAIGKNILWELLQDDTITSLPSERVRIEAENILGQLVCVHYNPIVKMSHMDACINNIQNDRSMVVSLRVMTKILSSLHQRLMLNEPNSARNQIMWLEQDMSLVDTILKSINTLARQHMTKTATVHPMDMELNARLDFMTYVFSEVTPQAFCLSTQQSIDLWDSVELMSSIHMDDLCIWFISHCQSRVHHAVHMETILHLYLDRLIKLPSMQTTLMQFLMFREFFRIIQLSDGYQIDLGASIDFAMSVMFHCVDDDLCASAVEFVNSTCLSSFSEDDTECKLFSRCISQMSNFIDSYLTVSRWFNRGDNPPSRHESSFCGDVDNPESDENKIITELCRAINLLHFHYDSFLKQFSIRIEPFEPDYSSVGIAEQPHYLIKVKLDNRSMQPIECHASLLVGRLTSRLMNMWCEHHPNEANCRMTMRTTSGRIQPQDLLQSSNRDRSIGELISLSKNNDDVVVIEVKRLVVNDMGSRSAISRTTASGGSLPQRGTGVATGTDAMSNPILVNTPNVPQLIDVICTRHLNEDNKTYCEVMVKCMAKLHQYSLELLRAKVYCKARRNWLMITKLTDVICWTPSCFLGDLDALLQNPELLNNNEDSDLTSINLLCRLLIQRCRQTIIKGFGDEQTDFNAELKENFKPVEKFKYYAQAILDDHNEIDEVAVVMMSNLLRVLMLTELKLDPATLNCKTVANTGGRQRSNAGVQTSQIVDMCRQQQYTSMPEATLVVEMIVKLQVLVSGDQSSFMLRGSRDMFMKYSMATIQMILYDQPMLDLDEEQQKVWLRTLLEQKPGCLASQDSPVILYNLLLLEKIPWLRDSLVALVSEDKNVCSIQFATLLRHCFDNLGACLSEPLVKNLSALTYNILDDNDEDARSLEWKRAIMGLLISAFRSRCDAPCHSLVHNSDLDVADLVLDSILDVFVGLPSPYILRCGGGIKDSFHELILELCLNNGKRYSKITGMLKKIRHENSWLDVREYVSFDEHSSTPGPLGFLNNNNNNNVNDSTIDADNQTTEYVGMVNMSATCYMASCMQQLFMQPEFRATVLETDCAGVVQKHRDLFKQLQVMFAYLQFSDKKAFYPKEFCQLYTFENQPMNVLEQRDMTEFYTDILAKLEEMSPSLKKVVEDIFTGKMIHRIESLECPHISYSEEAFTFIRAVVTDVSSLEESLARSTVCETLEGDNMFICSSCNDEKGCAVRARSKTGYSKLPKLLAINTMRYSFNVSAMTRDKVNSRFSFPALLDMGPYMDTPDPSFLTAKKIWYALIGVTIHAGSSELGHYYSFIRERTHGRAAKTPEAHDGEDGSRKPDIRWLSFNDTDVKVFNPNLLPTEAFGGDMYSFHYSQQVRRVVDCISERTNSAYMLFYERVDCDNDVMQLTMVDDYLIRKTIDFKLSETLEMQCKIADENQIMKLRQLMAGSNGIQPLIWDLCTSISCEQSQTTKHRSLADCNDRCVEGIFLLEVNDEEDEEQQANDDLLSAISAELLIATCQLSLYFTFDWYIHHFDRNTMTRWISLIGKEIEFHHIIWPNMMKTMSEEAWMLEVLLGSGSAASRQIIQGLLIRIIDTATVCLTSNRIRCTGELRAVINKFTDTLVAAMHETSRSEISIWSTVQTYQYFTLLSHVLNKGALMIRQCMVSNGKCLSNFLAMLIDIAVPKSFKELAATNFRTNKRSKSPSRRESKKQRSNNAQTTLLAVSTDNNNHGSVVCMQSTVELSVDECFINVTTALLGQLLAADPNPRAATRTHQEKLSLLLVHYCTVPWVSSAANNNHNNSGVNNVSAPQSYPLDVSGLAEVIKQFCLRNREITLDFIALLQKVCVHGLMPASTSKQVIVMLSELLSDFPHMNEFSQAIIGRLPIMMHDMPLHTMDFLVSQVKQGHPVIHEWVVRKMPEWVNVTLLRSESAKVRLRSRNLLLAICPFPEISSLSNGTLLMPKNSSRMTIVPVRLSANLSNPAYQPTDEEKTARKELLWIVEYVIHVIKNVLDELQDGKVPPNVIPRCRGVANSKGTTHSNSVGEITAQRLDYAFEFLTLTVCCCECRSLFGAFCPDVWQAFRLASLDHSSVNWSRYTILSYIYQAITDSSEMCSTLLLCSDAGTELANAFLVVEPGDQESLVYNRNYLAILFGCILECAGRDGLYRQTLIGHEIVAWGLTNVVLQASSYPQASERFLVILRVLLDDGNFPVAETVSTETHSYSVQIRTNGDGEKDCEAGCSKQSYGSHPNGQSLNGTEENDVETARHKLKQDIYQLIFTANVKPPASISVSLMSEILWASSTDFREEVKDIVLVRKLPLLNLLSKYIGGNQQVSSNNSTMELLSEIIDAIAYHTGYEGMSTVGIWTDGDQLIPKLIKDWKNDKNFTCLFKIFHCFPYHKYEAIKLLRDHFTAKRHSGIEHFRLDTEDNASFIKVIVSLCLEGQQSAVEDRASLALSASTLTHMTGGGGSGNPLCGLPLQMNFAPIVNSSYVRQWLGSLLPQIFVMVSSSIRSPSVADILQAMQLTAGELKEGCCLFRPELLEYVGRLTEHEILAQRVWMATTRTDGPRDSSSEVKSEQEHVQNSDKTWPVSAEFLSILTALVEPDKQCWLRNLEPR